jgi:dTDP-4-amino-4,6-dideoxygalactose transaminase
MKKTPGSRATMLVFGAPAIEEAEIAEVVDSLRSGWIGTGPKVARFESDFAAYKGVPAEHASAVSSCTAALHLSLIAAGIGAGDEVITVPLTFCATVNAILHVGATPVLVDVDPETMTMDPARIEASVTGRTKAILPVHFAGRACEMDPIMDVARRHGLKVIEDCAHAIETEYRGRKAGTFGDFGCFSFYVTKNVATIEGGMVLARSAEEAARVRVLALHGLSWDAWGRHQDEGFEHYDVVDCGYKANMTDVQAALGIHQLARVETNWKRRHDLWETYQRAFSELSIRTPAASAPDTRHAHHLYTVLVDPERCGLSRDGFLKEMTARNIGVGVHYRSLAEHPYYRHRFGWRAEDWPQAHRIGRQTVSLPLSAALRDEDVQDVIAAVHAVLGTSPGRP